jgi:hypothetical protein
VVGFSSGLLPNLHLLRCATARNAAKRKARLLPPIHPSRPMHSRSLPGKTCWRNTNPRRERSACSAEDAVRPSTVRGFLCPVCCASAPGSSMIPCRRGPLRTPTFRRGAAGGRSAMRYLNSPEGMCRRARQRTDSQRAFSMRRAPAVDLVFYILTDQARTTGSNS